jgi:hypothetical protein
MTHENVAMEESNLWGEKRFFMYCFPYFLRKFINQIICLFIDILKQGNEAEQSCWSFGQLFRGRKVF